MKTQLIAALLFSTAIIAAPAFANGNANLGNDTSAWAGASTMTRAQVGSQLIASEQANRATSSLNISYPALPDTSSATTRADVRQQLASSSGKDLTSVDNATYAGV